MDITLFEGSFSSIAAVVSACVIVPLIIYLIYKFTIKEKSFEEVLEEQKRQNIEEELRQKSEKNKKKEKFKRSWSKKKEKAEIESIVPENVTPVEETKEIPVIIEPKEFKPAKQKNKKQQFPPLVNSTPEASPVTEKSVKEVVTVEKHAQEKKESSSQPKKDVSIQEKKDSPLQTKKESEKNVNKQSPKQAAVDQKKKTTEVVETLASTVSQSVPASTSTNVANKKKKKEPVETDLSLLTANKLFSLVKDVALDTDEIQRMIDILLNKQKDSAGWTKPHDSLANVKKSLQEKEQRLELEVRQNQAVVSKLKDVRDECTHLKEKYTALEKSSSEKMGKLQHEIQVYQNRLKQLQDDRVAEKEKICKLERQQAEEKKRSEEDAAKVQREISKLEIEAKSVGNKAEMDELKASKEKLQKAHALLMDKLDESMSSHKVEVKQLTIQVADLKKVVEGVNGEKANLLKEFQAVKNNTTLLEKAKLILEEKLQNEIKQSADLDARLKQLSSSNVNLIQLQTEIKTLQLENERLAEQLVSTKERVAGDGQEIVHQNGEVNGNIPDETTLKTLEEKSQLLNEKESELFRLNDELNQLKAKVNLMEEEIETQKKKNNDLREKNWKTVEALKKTEESAEAHFKQLDAANQRLDEVEKEFEAMLKGKEVAVFQSSEARVAKMESKAAKRLADYNGEVEKSQRLMSDMERVTAQKNSAESRLSVMEKTIEELSSQIKDSQCRTRECLQRIHPEISVDNTLPHNAWIEEFEKLVLVSANITAPSPNDAEVTRLKNLLEEKTTELADKEHNFQNVLSDLETTLHNLESSALSKERSWQEELKFKESELQKLVSEKVALAAEKDAVQTTFQQQGQVEELEIKLKELKSELDIASNERSQFEQKYEEINKNCLNLRNQLENTEQQVTELQGEKNSVEHLRESLCELKEELDKEKKVNKDFSSQMIRLTSLVKIGTDALAAEQEMVKKLKSQLEALQVLPTNGGTTITNTVIQKESQPKPKPKASEKPKKKSDASVKK